MHIYKKMSLWQRFKCWRGKHNYNYNDDLLKSHVDRRCLSCGYYPNRPKYSEFFETVAKELYKNFEELDFDNEETD